MQKAGRGGWALAQVPTQLRRARGASRAVGASGAGSPQASQLLSREPTDLLLSGSGGGLSHRENS